MKEFASQIKLQQWQVDEAQRRLSQMQRLADRFNQDLQAIDRELAAEAKAAAQSLEARRTYFAYLTGAEERRAKLIRSIAEVEQQISQQRDLLAASFGELKKFEIASAAAATRMQQLRDRREQQRADEIGLGIYRRRVAR